MSDPTQILDRYLSEAQDAIHQALGLCWAESIDGFGDLRLLASELQGLRNRIEGQKREAGQAAGSAGKGSSDG